MKLYEMFKSFRYHTSTFSSRHFCATFCSPSKYSALVLLFYRKKSRLLWNNVPYLNTWHGLYLFPMTMKARWFNKYVCKNEEQLLERLDQAILDVIDNPKKTQKTACIGTLL
jgi:hypothetical protein